MQTTALQDEIQPQTENRDSKSSEIIAAHDLTVIEQQMSNLD